MLDAFKIKPFDLEPVYAAWTDGPRFTGNSKQDPPVEEWLEIIKTGCIERNVPEEFWYKVAQHFMESKAKARLDELKIVITKVHGGKYRWTWKKFKIAMVSMGWDIDKTATETIKVSGKSSGLWFMRKKESKEEKVDPELESLKRTPPSRSNTSFWISKKPSIEEIQTESISRPLPARSESSFWPVIRNSKSETDTSPRPTPQKIKSDSELITTARGTPKPPTPSRSSTTDSEEITTVTHAPVWLLNACTALEYITSEHPKTMSVLSAILITAGSLPAIPAISAGAGGAILASGAVKAIGAIAVGLGQALNTSVKNSQEQHAQASSTTR